MGHREPEISGDEEGDPIWKPSNTNVTYRLQIWCGSSFGLSDKITKYKKFKKYIKNKNKKLNKTGASVISLCELVFFC